jgi:hypothetical protein
MVSLLFENSPVGVVQMREGEFTIRHVPPGKYTLRAQSAPYTAEQPLEVSADVAGISLTPRQAASSDIQGVIHFEGGAQPRPMRLELRDPFAATIAATSKPDGSFVFSKVPAGHYEFLNVPQMRYVRGVGEGEETGGSLTTVAMQLGSKDVLNQYLDLDGSPPGLLEITLAPPVAARLGDVRITVRNRWDEPALGAMVMVAPVKAAGMRLTTTTDANGTINLRGLAPGDYRIYVVATDGETGVFQDPDWLGAHEKEPTALRMVPGHNPPVVIKLPR